MAKNIYAKRKFLNPEQDQTAYIIAVVPSIELNKEGKPQGFYPTLELKDCYRQVNLSFDVYDLKDAKKIRKKLFTFKKIVNEFVAASSMQLDEFEKLYKSAPKSKPKK